MREVDTSGESPLLQSIHEEKRHAHLTHSIEHLLRKTLPYLASMQRKRIWLISSTSRGGGVAEMMPRFIFLLREFGVRSKWLIIDSDKEMERKFFSLTKKIHNNIHGDTTPLDRWVPDWLADSASPLQDLRQLFEAVNEANTAEFFDKFCPDFDPKVDVVIIHDPQPAGMGPLIKARHPAAQLIWRCHVGLDRENDSTRAAWNFLDPYITKFDKCVFSARDYVRESVKEKSVIIYPGISPLSEKNTELSPYEVSQILLRAGLMAHVMDTPELSSCAAVEDKFIAAASVYRCEKSAGCVPDALGTMTEGLGATTPVKNITGGSADLAHRPIGAQSSTIGFLHRPIVSQISRWDRLKGWIPLMEAWAELKANGPRYAQCLADTCYTTAERMSHSALIHARILENACLVLAGPDPNFIQDDPEGLEVLRELKTKFDSFPPEIQRDIKIIELPMESQEENALIVNAIQRASMVIVQNSLREGFGLTATEALFKRICFVGTEQACGLRTQVRHGIDGLLVQGDPSDPVNVAKAINTALSNRLLRERLAVNGQKRAYDEFLVYNQIEKWIDLLHELTEHEIEGECTAETKIHLLRRNRSTAW